MFALAEATCVCGHQHARLAGERKCFSILKVFTVDLAELDRIYRISSIVGLGIALLISSYLYQRLEKECNQ